MARNHLSLEEIEWLAEGPRKAFGIPVSAAHVEEAMRHLGECDLCQGLVQTYEDLERRLGQLKATGETRLGPDCPAETEWWRVAAGLLPESQAAELLEHAIRCDVCRSLLREATQDFAEEVTEQEIAQLSALPSAQEEWHRSLAQRLSAAQSKRGMLGNAATVASQWIRELADRFAWRPGGIFRYAWAYAAAAIVLLAAGAWTVQTRRANSVDQLIASAYTEQRPFEPRIAGAAYGPIRQERGGERSAFAEPAGLLRAKYLIKERLAERPDDGAMLAASGRVELLEGHYDEAIRTFGRLLDVHPDSPALLTDLATGYFQRAEAAGRAIDYGQAIELLGRALAKSPDDPLALFNRAIALEKMYAYNEAIRDWEHYLRVDPGGNWAAEAQRRLSELRERMKARDKPLALLRPDPVAATPFLRARSTGQATFSAPWAASLDEEYLDLAVREWLPSLYVSVESENRKIWRRDPAVWDALSATSDVLNRHHKDPWLADLLHDLPTDSARPNAVGQFVRAFDLLAQAAKANASGDPDAAGPLAESAARSFRIAKSHAGYLRAREEVIYSLVRATKATDCIRVAGQQVRELNLASYGWLKVQAILWHATCQSFSGNLGLAQHLSEQALELNRSTGFEGQHLRSVLFASGFLRSTERNWQDTRAGLQQFWAGWHNPFHAYESYVELAHYAEDADRWHLTRLLLREALGMIDKTPDHLFRAAAHEYLAVAAMRIRDLTEAESEFQIASQQFAALPSSPTTRRHRAGSEIHLAIVESQQGRLDLAEAHLEQARPHLADISSTWTAFNYYQALGQLYLRRQDLSEAEKALWSALQVSEARLSSLQSDEDRLAWERDAARAYRTLVELYVRKPDANSRGLELWEWYLASALRGSTHAPLPKKLRAGNSSVGPGPSLPSQVRDTLPILKHETIISFARLPSGPAAWSFDDRGVNFAWISASEEDLARRVRHLVYLCADPSSDLAKLMEEGRNLYDLLLAPFERHLEPGRLLIIEPDSFLSDVPWSALADVRGEYFGSRFAFVVSPGLGYWLDLRTPTAITPQQRVLVVGAPVLAPSVAERFSPLPDADREARNIAALFRHSRLLLAKEVTLLAIRRELSRSDVFHFAGHAVSGIKQSGLVLASLPDLDGSGDEPTLLSGRQLGESLLRRVRLVVLSACVTAEPDKGFAEPETLLRGFLRAGVPHVVASRWPVDSHTTAETMAEFYDNLFRGFPAAQALQHATGKLRLRPGTSHPYYWAGFGSYGR